MEAMALAIHLRTLITEVAIDIGINNPVGLGVPVLGLLGLVLVGLESASEWMVPGKGSLMACRSGVGAWRHPLGEGWRRTNLASPADGLAYVEVETRAYFVCAGHLQSGLASSVVYACIAAARWFIPLVAKALTLCVIGIEMIPLRPLFAWVHPFITEPPTMRGRRNGPTKMKTEPTRG